MIRIAIAGLALATLSAAAHARPDYDARIDAAAAEIVAAKIGELRGGFAFGIAPKMTRSLDREATGALVRRETVDPTHRQSAENATVAPRGLVPAVEVRFAVPVSR